MSGPARQPTALRLLQGNPSRRPIVMDEFRPVTAIPAMPKHLKGEAKKEWLRITAELAKYGLISEVDRDALAMICTIWSRYVVAEQIIDRMAKKSPETAGLFVNTPNNFPVQSPWLALSNRAMEMYKSFLAEFGMSPASRMRVSPGESLQTEMFAVEGAENKWKI